jgi:hypothetical protein
METLPLQVYNPQKTQAEMIQTMMTITTRSPKQNFLEYCRSKEENTETSMMGGKGREREHYFHVHQATPQHAQSVGVTYYSSASWELAWISLMAIWT